MKYDKGEKKYKGLYVEVRNGDMNGALRKFKRKVNHDGVLLTLKDKQAYQKPSEKRKMAKAAGRARHLKKIAKRKEEYGY